jgi:L-asparagine transporter-like permease
MAEQAGFERNVGLFMAVMVGIGAMMGPGVFALPSEVAELAGPLGIVAYLAMGGSRSLRPSATASWAPPFRLRGAATRS